MRDKLATWLLRLSIVLALAVMLSGNPLGWALAQSAFRLLNGTLFENHMVVGGLQPTATNGTIANGSTDLMGKVTLTGGNSSTVVTFATAWNVAPFCFAADGGGETGQALKAVATLTTLTITGAAANEPIVYQCLGTSNN